MRTIPCVARAWLSWKAHLLLFLLSSSLATAQPSSASPPSAIRDGILPLSPGGGLAGFGNVTYERITDDSISWGLTTLEAQLDPFSGGLQSDTTTAPLVQIAPDIYWLSYVFSGARCGVVSFNDSCSNSLTWFIAEFEPIRESYAEGTAPAIQTIIDSYGVNASVCLSNCSNQAFPLEADVYYTMGITNSNMTSECAFSFKLDIYSFATCESSNALTGLPASEPQSFAPSPGPDITPGIVPGLIFAHWAYVSNDDDSSSLDMMPEQTFFHDAAVITNAHCIAFAIWTPTEPAANLPLYNAYLFSQQGLTEGLYSNVTYSFFRTGTRVLADCSGATCNAVFGQWTGAYNLSPKETYHLVALPLEPIRNGSAQQQVFQLVQAFTSDAKCASLQQRASSSAPMPAGAAALISAIGIEESSPDTPGLTPSAPQTQDNLQNEHDANVNGSHNPLAAAIAASDAQSAAPL
ncbi:hypothetical protein WJX73_002000 [Symbiochloris irregularis]|uniref:Uncharacterized protein n=1 Tax=Symbiochloris irregularis TaxID=706552 RepID=A0AAW1PMY6_9CHLO